MENSRCIISSAHSTMNENAGMSDMGSKATMRLVLVLTVAVAAMAICDVILMAAAPWWLKNIYEGNYGSLKIMLGYTFSPSGLIYPLMLGFFYLSGLLCLIILCVAFRILRRIRRSLAFCTENARGLEVASLCAFGLFAVFMAKMFFSPSILTVVCGGIFLLFGLFVMVMAQMVRVATRIREENELTI